MRHNGLNLSALRHLRFPRTSRSVDVTNLRPELKLSRREVLGLTGAAALGLSPMARAVQTGVTGPFQLSKSRDRAAFKLGGTERWVIDPKRFAGNPTLSVEKTDELVLMEL